jgi:hypothetical protein
VSVYAVGPALDLDGPLPVAPPHGLLSVPGVVVADGERWLNGVNVYGYPEGTPSLWDPCSTGTFRDKGSDSTQSLPRFDSFALYVPITCSSLSIGNWEEFAGRAEAVLEATQSFGVEQALALGTGVATNPFLGDANVTVLGGGAVTPAVGLSWLEDAIGGTGRMGMIHATPAIVAAWSEYLTDDAGTLRTASGTPVVSGGGYIGADANGAAPGAGEGYAFATGPVEVRLSEAQLVGDDINGTLDTSDNTVTFRAERYALTTWDTALQSAVLVNWTP